MRDLLRSCSQMRHWCELALYPCWLLGHARRRAFGDARGFARGVAFQRALHAVASGFFVINNEYLGFGHKESFRLNAEFA